MASKREWYRLPRGEYDPQFLKALAMAAHCNVIEPAELHYWFENKWTQKEMTVEMFNRVKASRSNE